MAQINPRHSLVHRYHLGTVAFGSLVLSILYLIRVLLKYLDGKARKGCDTGCSYVISCLCKCCIWYSDFQVFFKWKIVKLNFDCTRNRICNWMDACPKMIETCVRFVNRYAYVSCAIDGTNFCQSTSQAFKLFLKHVEHINKPDKADTVANFLLFIGQMVIVMAMAMLSFYVFADSYVTRYVPPTNYFVVPVITIIMGSYFISSLFFSVYTVVINTRFLCFRKFFYCLLFFF